MSNMPNAGPGGMPMNNRFEWVSDRSSKVRCVLCGRTGYGEIEPDLSRLPDAWWQRKCMKDHDLECICGKRYVTNMQLAGHIRKTGHQKKDE